MSGPTLSPAERQLLDGCRKGDNAAWLALFRTHAADIGGFLRGMLRGSDDIDDLVQQVFLGFMSSLDSFRGDASLRTWLLRIARNLALREIRTRSRRQRHVQAYATAVGPVAAPAADGQVDARARLALVQRMLDQLDQKFREVWILRELNGCSVAEAALILDLPEATVRTRHHRARRALLERMGAIDDRDAAVLQHQGDPPWTLIRGGAK